MHQNRIQPFLIITYSPKSYTTLPFRRKRCYITNQRSFPKKTSKEMYSAISPTFASLNTTKPKMSTSERLTSTWAERAWLAAGSTTVVAALSHSIIISINTGATLQPALSGLAGYVLADLGTGVYHFLVDNYGSASTPFFGPQIAAFQGHHHRPSTIARRQPANNLHSLAKPVALFLLPIELLLILNTGTDRITVTTGVVQAFIGVCAGCIVMSQQFHAWAHERRDRVPGWVEAMQNAGVIISREAHGVHHRVPYDRNYCIVSGIWNKVLDEYRFFRAVEMVVFFWFGVRARSWGETSDEWKEEEEDD